MTQSETWTIGRLLQWTTDYLKQHGSESPRLDAEVLLAHARSCDRIQLYTDFEAVAAEPLRTAFRELVRRRSEGTPVAYLVGQREFYSLSFDVTPDVLIPRPETEFVVVTLLDLVKEHYANQAPRIIDVGTGSGILAVCSAVHAPQAVLTAIDVSTEALEVARRNAAKHHVDDRIEFVESNLFESVAPEQRFDFVISNPPYISQKDYLSLSPQVREHEPRSALLGGDRGTEVIEPLIEQSQSRLRSGGWLIFEICPSIVQPCRDLVRQSAGFGEPTIVKDLAQLPRVVVAQRRVINDE